MVIALSSGAEFGGSLLFFGRITIMDNYFEMKAIQTVMEDGECRLFRGV